ncbi:two-component system alkaline phosphatase synthesis response regulator PhoP [Natranaerovirga pectinivora]|uniref:Stage 0 sporulation protein A homolog n=1 Tax=Natranaerovirga pectinivora TaxID=682400 RepID=A0A4R3MLX9_9FIRM|nr:response regulator transcription factor [Natranaerovirga pectinivora]TCT15688.1 two-component system alkaline phosphatase synthesis response regulator PhoP [Natranaerovirga pectinivora]
MSKKVILTVDDEEHILELLKYNLESNSFSILQADTGEKALEIIETEKIDLVLLDQMLPGIDGIQVLKTIRNTEQFKKLPVILLTAKSEEIDTVIGLEMGADDYIGKPFGVHELVARIKAVLRRTEEEPKGEVKVYDLITIDEVLINKSTHTVHIKDKTIELPLKEFELLYLLAKNRGRVFSRDYLLEKIWGYDYYGETRTVDVHIRNLRKKIEDDDKNPKFIKTVRGVGYKFIEKGK